MSTELVRDSAEVVTPTGVKFHRSGHEVTAEGPLGKVRRPYPAEALAMTITPGKVSLKLTIPWNRREAQALLHTWEAHLKNMAGGVTRGVEAKMKVVAAHFPMKVAVKEDHILIENFLGEKFPRTATLVKGVEAKVDGDIVVLTGVDVEQVGQSTANVERATRIRDYDPRVFQDGIYLTERAHLKEAE